MQFAREVFLSCIIVLYLFQAIVSLCAPSDLQKALVKPGSFFANFWGLNQSWTLFSPTIRDINYHLTATITFDDGTMMLWELPRMERLSLLDRFRLEKFRKWSIDSLPWVSYKPYWSDFARYAGKLFATPNHRPVQLALYLFWSKIPAPSPKLVDRYQLPEHDHSDHIFTYFYTPEDLQ